MKCHKVCGLHVLSSDVNGKRKQHDQVKHLGPLFLTGRNASSHRCLNLGCCTSKLAPGNPVCARTRNSSEGRLSHVWKPQVHEQARDGRRALAHGSHAHRAIGFPGCTALLELIHMALQHVRQEVQKHVGRAIATCLQCGTLEPAMHASCIHVGLLRLVPCLETVHPSSCSLVCTHRTHHRYEHLS